MFEHILPSRVHDHGLSASQRRILHGLSKHDVSVGGCHDYNQILINDTSGETWLLIRGLICLCSLGQHEKGKVWAPCPWWQEPTEVWRWQTSKLPCQCDVCPPHWRCGIQFNCRHSFWWSHMTGYKITKFIVYQKKKSILTGWMYIVVFPNGVLIRHGCKCIRKSKSSRALAATPRSWPIRQASTPLLQRTSSLVIFYWLTFHIRSFGGGGAAVPLKRCAYRFSSFLSFWW